MNTDTPGLGPMLHDAARLMRKRFEVRSAAFGLSSAQWRMMVHVCKLGSAPQSRLAEMLEIEPISASRLLDRMEQQGWITRSADPGDRRVRRVMPTDKALHAFDDIKLMAEDVYAEALSGMAEADRRILMAGLSAIVSNLSGGESPDPKVSE